VSVQAHIRSLKFLQYGQVSDDCGGSEESGDGCTYDAEFREEDCLFGTAPPGGGICGPGRELLGYWPTGQSSEKGEGLS